MDEQPVNKHKNELLNLSVRDLFFKYIRFLPFIVLSVAIALFGAYAYLRYATEIYSSAGTMIIQNDPQNNRSDKVEDILLGTGKSQNIQNEMEVLRSLPLMERVVKKLNLSFDVVAMGKIKSPNVYKRTPFRIESFEITDSTAEFSFEIKFTGSESFIINGKALQFGQLFKNQYGVFRLNKETNAIQGEQYLVRWLPVNTMATNLVSNLTVMPKTPGTSIVLISLLAPNPRLASDVVNSLMSEYNVMNIEQNNFSTDQMLNFINERLVILNTELDSAQQKLLEYQQKNDLIDIDIQSEGYFKNVSEADKTVLDLSTRISVADMIENYLRDKRNQYNRVVVPSSLGLEDVTLNDLVASYNKVQLQRKALIDGNTPRENPLVKEAEGQIEALRESVQENLRNIKSSYLANIERINRVSGNNQTNIKALPYKIKELVELRRQVEIKLSLVKILEAKREEAAIARASTISSSRIINLAAESSTPVKPNRRMIQIMAILIGIGIPSLIIFIREIINDKVNTRNDIQKITETPIVGEVGHSYNDKVLVVNKVSRAMVAEQFRIIRSNLQYILNKVEKPVLMVTSSFSGEGKSFISTNMGAVMALAGKKTVILEFDIRKPKVLAGLDMSKKAGISNFLVGKGELKDLVIPVPGTELLYVLPCGPIPPNPSELLLDPKVDEMFAYLREHFDVIIIDTAPVGMVSDGITLGKYADSTLYIVRQGYTYTKQIALIDQFYKENKLPRISIVVNDVKMKSGYGYYGYGRYGYGYGYGNAYYEEEVEPPTYFGRIWNSITGIFKKKKRK
jgi:tyrosine-protein kinase Etk/Wzc